MDMTRFLSLNLYWKKVTRGVNQIGYEPCDEEWQQYAAQTLEEHKDADNDDTEYDTADKTVECNLFAFHNALFFVFVNDRFPFGRLGWLADSTLGIAVHTLRFPPAVLVCRS